MSENASLARVNSTLYKGRLGGIKLDVLMSNGRIRGRFKSLSFASKNVRNPVNFGIDEGYIGTLIANKGILTILSVGPTIRVRSLDIEVGNL